MKRFGAIRWRENLRGISEMMTYAPGVARSLGEAWLLGLRYRLSDMRSVPPRGPAAHGTTVILTGGEFRNKGAQAMTFVAVDQIRRRCPDAMIYLFSPFGDELDESARRALRLTVLPWTWTVKRQLMLPRRMQRAGATERATLREISKALEHASCLVDISGYAFSSQWGGAKSLEYLAGFMVARRFGVPYFIFPQSLGPFDYRGLDRGYVPRWLIRRCLRGATRIYARENSGFRAVQACSPRNITRARDMVLVSPPPDLSRVYAVMPGRKAIDVEPGAVGVIPSVKVERLVRAAGLNDLYGRVVCALRAAGRAVYVLPHASEDAPLCRQIKLGFSGDEGVRLIGQDCDAPALEAVIGQFDFIVSSRYHAVVHAYRHGVPAVVLGWAEKYGELLEDFGQEANGFDLREVLDEQTLLDAVRRMLSCAVEERHRILSALPQLVSENPFDGLGLR